MKLHDLQPAPGSRHKSKRVGRGHGSGKGKTSGKGMMGQKSRSGPGPYRTFEGGQNRLVKRMPFKRGFTNIWQVEYQVVNLGALEAWPADLPVTSETLEKEGLISHRKAPLPLKILGDGELTTALTIHAHKFSASARQKIESSGGKVIEIPLVIERRSRSHGPNPSMRKAAPQSN